MNWLIDWLYYFFTTYLNHKDSKQVPYNIKRKSFFLLLFGVKEKKKKKKKEKKRNKKTNNNNDDNREKRITHKKVNKL